MAPKTHLLMLHRATEIGGREKNQIYVTKIFVVDKLDIFISVRPSSLMWWIALQVSLGLDNA